MTLAQATLGPHKGGPSWHWGWLGQPETSISLLSLVQTAEEGELAGELGDGLRGPVRCAHTLRGSRGASLLVQSEK